MRINLIKTVLAFAIWGLDFPTLIAKPPAERDKIDRVRRGMTPEEVRPLVGHPTQISRQILLRRHLEQWHLEEPAAVIEWNCQRGEVPYVLQAQKLEDE